MEGTISMPILPDEWAIFACLFTLCGAWNAPSLLMRFIEGFALHSIFYFFSIKILKKQN